MPTAHRITLAAPLTVFSVMLLRLLLPATPTLADVEGIADTPPAPAEQTLTPDQRAWLTHAEERFSLAGLTLPDVDVEFSDVGDCNDYGGLYFWREPRIRICRPSERTVIHEYAHAWVETNLDEQTRADFLELRGLDSWFEGEWAELGAEHAAEIVTWAVMEENLLRSWLETGPDGTTTWTFRLFKIPNSTPEDLERAYRLLTGLEPHLRTTDDPRAAPTTTLASPEAQRGR